MESGQASGQIPPKKGEQQAQLDVTCLPLAKGKKEEDPPTGNQRVLYDDEEIEISPVEIDLGILMGEK
ncbi:hypothetical protein DUI87_00774 [Hirundo rustica rustica]|uniref:Uncharacterized protein n=1 Tax=Hirundo rustica rustica TaxID=333673 RepID=A0A3M0LHK5_HIRRU|nr:hypothetical protein DUI87_00774 [Hirundo rustica rustica]